MAKSAARRPSSAFVTRFAHPFFTTVHPDQRGVVPGAERGVRRMTDHIRAHLEKIPPARGTSTMKLADIIGDDDAQAIEHSGSILLHAGGDSGHVNGRPQELVADAMTADYDIAHPEKCPAFLLHLGDVIYYDNTDEGYHAQFYAPYKSYPGKIVAIPGNHDGERFKFDGKPTGQKTSLEAFQKNFCQTGSKSVITSGTILRHMVSQPGVYWRVNAPFVDIVGLYSNVAENPGYIQSPEIGDAQKKWLTKTLKTIATERAAGSRKALLFAVHHPPLSNGSHSSSVDMLADLDDSCRTAKTWPDAVLAAHAHDYQRFTRFVTADGGTKMEVPYVVCGTLGRGLSTKLAPASGQTTGDHRYDKSLLAYGYLRLKIAPQLVQIAFVRVDEHSGQASVFDTVAVDLKTHKLK